MSLISAMWLLAQCAILASLLLVIVAFARIFIGRFRAMPLLKNRAELAALGTSLAAAVVGSIWLFTGPAYSGVTHTVSLSSNGVITRSVAEHSRSFYEANGPAVIPFFIVPVTFALLPFAFLRSRARPVVEGICAFLLSVQADIGMSGYGLFFMPSGVIMVYTGVLALREHIDQPGAPAVIRRADPAARRRLVAVLAAGAFVGALLIVGFERYHIPLRDWLLSEPGASAQRVKSVFLLLAALLIAPLLVFAAYLWWLGGRVLRAREFPPPGFRVIRDSPVITGDRAIFRGRLLKMLALVCGIALVTLGLLLWRLASFLSGNAA